MIEAKTELLDNELLSKEEVDIYDYAKLRALIVRVFKLFKHIRRRHRDIPLPRITTNWNVVYEQRVPIYSSAVEDFTLKTMMAEAEEEETRMILLSKITEALMSLNPLEVKVFKLAYFERKSEEDIAETINYCYKKVREIKKSACIKFLTVLNVDDQCFKDD